MKVVYTTPVTKKTYTKEFGSIVEFLRTQRKGILKSFSSDIFSNPDIPKIKWSALSACYKDNEIFIVNTVSSDSLLLGKFIEGDYVKGYYAYLLIASNVIIPFNLDKKI